MKYEKLFYGLGSLVVIAGAVMKIFHFPYGSPILLFGFIGIFLYQIWHIGELKKRIKDLESKS